MTCSICRPHLLRSMLSLASVDHAAATCCNKHAMQRQQSVICAGVKDFEGFLKCFEVRVAIAGSASDDNQDARTRCQAAAASAVRRLLQSRARLAGQTAKGAGVSGCVDEGSRKRQDTTVNWAMEAALHPILADASGSKRDSDENQVTAIWRLQSTSFTPQFLASSAGILIMRLAREQKLHKRPHCYSKVISIIMLTTLV